MGICYVLYDSSSSKLKLKLKLKLSHGTSLSYTDSLLALFEMPSDVPMEEVEESNKTLRSNTDSLLALFEMLSSVLMEEVGESKRGYRRRVDGADALDLSVSLKGCAFRMTSQIKLRTSEPREEPEKSKGKNK